MHHVGCNVITHKVYFSGEISYDEDKDKENAVVCHI